MPWLLQMLGFGLFLVGVAIALWVSVWVLVVLFIIMTGYAILAGARDTLVKKGVLNPRPGLPPEEITESADTHITIVDGEFTRVDEEKR